MHSPFRVVLTKFIPNGTDAKPVRPNIPVLRDAALASPARNRRVRVCDVYVWPLSARHLALHPGIKLP